MSQTSAYDDALSLLDVPEEYKKRAQDQANANALRQEAGDRSSAAVENRRAANLENFVKRNAADGVPLDYASGMGAGVRAKLSFENNVDKQANMLKQQPGVVDVRKGPDGDLIARVRDGSGAVKDVVVNGRGISGGDVAALAGTALPVAAGMGAAFATSGFSLIPQALAVAAASNTAGGVQDFITRRMYGNEPDVGEIAGRRTMGAGVDAAVPIGLGAGKRAVQWAIGKSKFASGLENAAMDAVARLRAESGVPLELSAAQASGNPLLARAEAFGANLPGSGPLKMQREKQADALRQIQRFILGEDPAKVEGEAEIATKTKSILGFNQRQAERGVAGDMNAAQGIAQNDIKNLLNASTVPKDITPTEAGIAVRAKMLEMRDKFRATAENLYNDVYVKAGGNDVVVPTRAVKATVDAIESKLPEAATTLAPEIKRVLDVGKSLIDKDGNPIPIGLRQARELRSLVGDMIDQGQPTSSIPQRYLVQLKESLTQSIDDGVKASGNPEVAMALKDANTYYRNNVDKFHQTGIGSLFRDANQPGGVGDSTLVRNIFAGEGDLESLRRFKNMLGANSPEYKGLVRAGLNEMLDNAAQGESFVQGDRLLSSMRGWRNAEFRREALGPIEKELTQNGELLRLAQGAKLSADDVERVLAARPGTAADTMRNAIEKQKNLDRFYKSRLVKELNDGVFDPATLNPDEFVSRFVQNASADETRSVLMHLRSTSPELTDAIRRRTMLNLLQRSQREALPDEAIGDGLSRLSYDKLQKFVSGPDVTKYEAIVGKDAMNNLRDLMLVEAVKRKSENAAGAAGSLVTSNVLASFMRFKPDEIPMLIQNRIVAGILTSPATRSFARGLITIPDTPRARLAAMASPPVLQAISEEFKNEPDVLGAVIDAIGKGRDAQAVKQSRGSHQDALDLIQGR